MALLKLLKMISVVMVIRKEQTMNRCIELEPLIADLDKGLWGKDYDKALAEAIIQDAPTIEIIRCRECKYASDDGTYGCMCEHFNDTSDAYHRMWSDDFCSYGERNSSEKPNNCEHITEDGVTCAKYPACDDCLDNPLNKVKGSERLVKGSEQTEPTGYNLSPVDKDINVRSKDEPQTCDTCKWGEWYRQGYDITMMDDECGGCCSWRSKWTPKDEPQTNADQHVQHVESVEQIVAKQTERSE